MSGLIGLPVLLARLTRTAIVGEVAADAGAAIAKGQVETTAKGLAPVDTGALRASIQQTDEGVEAGVTYAVFVEYGTADTPQQPFLRPAADTVNEGPIALAVSAVMGRA